MIYYVDLYDIVLYSTILRILRMIHYQYDILCMKQW